MKLTELKCAACGGSVKPVPENPGIVECEYCNSRFIVEAENNMTPLYGNPISYTPMKEPERKKDGEFRWWHGLLMAALLLGGVIAIFGPQLYRKSRGNQMTGNPEMAQNGEEDFWAGMEKNAKEGAQGNLSKDPIFSAFCEAAFSKSAEELSEAERSEIKWLEFGSDIDNWKIGYSLESPLEQEEAELTWFSFPKKDFPQADLSCLSAFPALTFIGSNQAIEAGNLAGLPITGIKGNFSSLEEAAQLADNPEAVKWVDISGASISLAGIEKFPNLETLVINGKPDDEKILVRASNLKSLSLDLYDENLDFTTVSMIPGLERLSISCNNLRDISFLEKMENLKSLHIQHGIMISVEPLRSCAQLTELSIESCDEIKDLSAVSALTNVKKLSLDLPYQCSEPDLSTLTQVENLRLVGFEGADFLASMENLESLTLDSCYIEDSKAFAGLTNLKNLSCTSFGSMQSDYSFIPYMTGIETIDLHGTETYDDLSGIFNLPALKSLNLSGMSCEIDFDNIAENTSLKELYIDNMKLYKNVQISGGNGIYSINYDDVHLTENLSFLGKLKGLEKLSVRENELSEISFAAEIPALQAIDFSENYVTDVSPLSGLKNLKTVTGTNNPVTNYEVLADSVIIFE